MATAPRRQINMNVAPKVYDNLVLRALGIKKSFVDTVLAGWKKTGRAA